MVARLTPTYASRRNGHTRRMDTSRKKDGYAVTSENIYDVLAMMNVDTMFLTQRRLRRETKVEPGVERRTKVVVILYQSPSGYRLMTLRLVGKL